MSAFSNGTEHDIFYDRWCEHCTGDAEMRDTGMGGCPIILNAFIGEPTPELIDDGRQVTCTAFDDIDAPKPQPIEVSPDQLTLEEA